MTTLVIYDIVENKTRNRIATACLDYGLERVQYSAFLGNLNHNRREELFRKVSDILGKQTGRIQVFAICDKDVGLVKERSAGEYKAERTDE